LRKTIAVVAGSALAVSAFAPVAFTQAESSLPKSKVVKVRDNFFAPDSLTVAKQTKIIWRWPSTPGDVHDVYLSRRPDGVKRFHSDLAGSDYSFARRLKKSGRYTIVCTIHAEMTMKVKVKR
jgi:plastocyanin